MDTERNSAKLEPPRAEMDTERNSGKDESGINIPDPPH
jgi:hypothetical protein